MSCFLPTWFCVFLQMHQPGLLCPPTGAGGHQLDAVQSPFLLPVPKLPVTAGPEFIGLQSLIWPQVRHRASFLVENNKQDHQILRSNYFFFIKVVLDGKNAHWAAASISGRMNWDTYIPRQTSYIGLNIFLQSEILSLFSVNCFFIFPGCLTVCEHLPAPGYCIYTVMKAWSGFCAVVLVPLVVDWKIVQARSQALQTPTYPNHVRYGCEESQTAT